VATLLKVEDVRATPQELWERFLERRSALEREMHLEVCDGCDACGTRCIAGFGVTQPEWEAVKEYLDQQPETDRVRVQSQLKTLPWPGAETEELVVTYCRFRDQENNRCSIYPVRPTICRLFGQASWLPCPIEAVPAYPEGAVALWNDYSREKRKTWEEWQEEEILAGVSNG
jgi:ferredoxin